MSTAAVQQRSPVKQQAAAADVGAPADVGAAAPAPSKRKRTEAERLQWSALAPPIARQAGSSQKIECAIPYEIESGGVPVFRPTMEQFKDFAQFIETVNVS